MFQLCGVFAELERSIIQERVKARLERARANGKILGRPRTDPRVEAKIRKLAGQGMGKGRFARTLGIGVRSRSACLRIRLDEGGTRSSLELAVARSNLPCRHL
jgi:DNA invertase Pin-like site-specific DNA recombinase